MNCHDADRFAESFIDRELAEADRLELEAHLLECSICRRLVHKQAELKATLRAVLAAPPAPERLLVQVSQRLDRVDEERSAQNGFLATLWPEAGKWPRRAAPALLLTLLLLIFTSPLPGALRESPLLMDSISKHQRNLPLEIAGNEEIVGTWFDNKVPFVVRIPKLSPVAILRGGRLVNLGDREAAHLLYEQRGQRISVFVFDARDLSLVAPRRTLIGQQEVYLEGQRGYSVAAFYDHGIGYVITTSLNEPELLQVLSTAVPR